MEDPNENCLSDAQSIKEANIKCFIYNIINKYSFLNSAEHNRLIKNLLLGKNNNFEEKSNYDYFNNVTDLKRTSIFNYKQYISITIKNTINSKNKDTSITSIIDQSTNASIKEYSDDLSKTRAEFSNYDDYVNFFKKLLNTIKEDKKFHSSEVIACSLFSEWIEKILNTSFNLKFIKMLLNQLIIIFSDFNPNKIKKATKLMYRESLIWFDLIFLLKTPLSDKLTVNPKIMLGEGATSRTYLSKYDKKQIATKFCILYHFGNNESRVAWIKNEIEILANLQHKNLNYIYSYKKINCSVAITQALYPNSTVAEIFELFNNSLMLRRSSYYITTVKENKPGTNNYYPSEYLLGYILYTIIFVINFLQKCRIAHLDVKCENLLLDDAFNPILIDPQLAIQTPSNEKYVPSNKQGTLEFLGKYLNKETISSRVKNILAVDLHLIGNNLIYIINGMIADKPISSINYSEETTKLLTSFNNNNESSEFSKFSKYSDELRSLIAMLVDPRARKQISVNEVINKNKNWIKKTSYINDKITKFYYITELIFKTTESSQRMRKKILIELDKVKFIECRNVQYIKKSRVNFNRKLIFL